MNFHGDLVFEGSIIRWIKRVPEKKQIEIVFDLDGNNETTFSLGYDFFHQLCTAIRRFEESPDSFYRMRENTDGGKGRIIPRFVFISMDKDEVVFGGDRDDPMDPPDTHFPAITLKSKKEDDGEIGLILDINHAKELHFRLGRLIEAYFAIEQAKEEKTIAPVA